MTHPQPDPELREQIARIIDPFAFAPKIEAINGPNGPGSGWESRRNAALANADQILILPALTRLRELEAERDAAYITMIDTAAFLRGYGDAADLAARRLIKAIPEDFDDREERARTALNPNGAT